MKQRPLSPFMIGPYYRPQLTSMLSITHRISGVMLGMVGVPLLIGWIIAVSRGPEALSTLQACLSGLIGKSISVLLIFSLCFHFFNGIRHLVWDSGRLLQIEQARRAGWTVLAATLATSVLLVWAML